MLIRRAALDDIPALARLLWVDTNRDGSDIDDLTGFATELARWWPAHEDSHRAFVAEGPDHELIGVAWVALQPRVPRPGSVHRFAADIQAVFVLPEHRGHGVGSAVVEAAVRHAAQAGALRVTVHSGRRAVPVYERLGFRSAPQLMQRLPD